MEIKQDMDFNDLRNNCWGQATQILEEISDADKEDALMDYLEDIFSGDIPTLTEVNDVLAYDWEQVYKDIGFFKLEDEIDEKALEKWRNDFEDWKKPRMITDGDMIGYGEESESELSDKIDEVVEKISDVCDAIDKVLDSDDMDDLEDAKDDLEDAYSDLTDLVEDYVDDSSKVYKALMDYDVGDFFENI